MVMPYKKIKLSMEAIKSNPQKASTAVQQQNKNKNRNQTRKQNVTRISYLYVKITHFVGKERQ